ncbi:MAG: sugar ABC transporter ATP-binding protein [Gemmatimonadales bacterium]
MTPAVRFEGITKRFPGVTALDAVTFEVPAAEVHAICGENGAGKSTLGRLLAGIATPDEGSIVLDGRSVRLPNPAAALAAGVAMVHQELALCDNLTVGENLCLGHLPRRGLLVDRAATRAQAGALLAEIGADLDPDREMSSLSIAERQLIQIASAVGSGARVIVYDEPTSSLGESETAALFALIGRLKARGVTQLYVSHRMAEIFALADRITVLRDGRHVATEEAGRLDEAAVVERMIGRRLDPFASTRSPHAIRDEALRVTGLSSPGRFEDISFSVRAGEIVGLAGLVGAGRSEVAHALFGLDRAATGTIRVRSRDVAIRSPRDAMALGIGFVPEDRKRQGLVLSMTVRANATLATLGAVSRWGVVRRRAERAAADGLLDRLGVRAGAEEAPVAELSGGNQQKVVMAKWLAAGSRILLLDEPTRGVDVAAKAELHGWIDRLAADGVAVVLISSELPELLSLADRIMVLRAGRIVGEIARAAADEARIVRLMTGIEAAG